MFTSLIVVVMMSILIMYHHTAVQLLTLLISYPDGSLSNGSSWVATHQRPDVRRVEDTRAHAQLGHRLMSINVTSRI